MAEVAELAAPERRGVTTIADGVVSAIALQAARLASTRTRGGLTGGGLPALDVVVTKGRARVRARVAAPWQEPAARTASAVAERIRSDLQRLAGVVADTVDVSVTEFVQVTEHGRSVR